MTTENQVKQQIQVVIDVVLVGDQDIAKERLACALFDLDDHTFSIMDCRETRPLDGTDRS